MDGWKIAFPFGLHPFLRREMLALGKVFIPKMPNVDQCLFLVPLKGGIGVI